MQFASYYNSLDENAKEEFAKEAGTTVGTIQHKYLPARQMIQKNRFRQFLCACKGQVSRSELLDHFFPPKEFEDCSEFAAQG